MGIYDDALTRTRNLYYRETNPVSSSALLTLILQVGNLIEINVNKMELQIVLVAL